MSEVVDSEISVINEVPGYTYEEWLIAGEIVRVSIRVAGVKKGFRLDMHDNDKNKCRYLENMNMPLNTADGENAFLWSLDVIESFLSAKSGESSLLESISVIRKFYENPAEGLLGADVGAFECYIATIPLITTDQSNS